MAPQRSAKKTKLLNDRDANGPGISHFLAVEESKHGCFKIKKSLIIPIFKMEFPKKNLFHHYLHPFSLYVCTSSDIFCKNQTSTLSSHRLALQWQKPTAEVMVAQQCTDLLLRITQQRDGDHMINNVNSKGVASDPWCPLTNHPIWFEVSGEQPNICRTSRVLRSIRLLFANDTNVVRGPRFLPWIINSYRPCTIQNIWNCQWINEPTCHIASPRCTSELLQIDLARQLQ